MIHTALILALCLLLPFNGDLFATLYPKSITTAIEMGEVQGTMSSLSIVVTGITVVLISPVAEILPNVFF
ncbi:LrgB family protein [Tetragenococcus halophilus]|uniref:LrgB family protein n=1 Tax=Tetragenococcus halophilus TaxID=51669 RepID=UPI0021BA907F|nr:LrgB family protein [Tetragenococcus halophilus]